MISRVRPNCRFGDSRSWGKCNAADREYCEGEKNASKFVNGHFDIPKSENALNDDPESFQPVFAEIGKWLVLISSELVPRSRFTGP